MNKAIQTNTHMEHKLICIVGMCGSGKSLAADYLLKVRNFNFVRFGQVCLDKVIEMGEQPTEELERKIREDLRQEYGMAAFAILNLPKFDDALKTADTIGDGLYSWAEYKVLKEKYGSNLIVICVYAPPVIRYERLENRIARHEKDTTARFRSIPKDAAADRDIAEIEKLDKGGPIAMADYMIVNVGTPEDVYAQLDSILEKIN